MRKDEESPRGVSPTAVTGSNLSAVLDQMEQLGAEYDEATREIEGLGEAEVLAELQTLGATDPQRELDRLIPTRRYAQGSDLLCDLTGIEAASEEPSWSRASEERGFLLIDAYWHAHHADVPHYQDIQ